MKRAAVLAALALAPAGTAAQELRFAAGIGVRGLYDSNILRTNDARLSGQLDDYRLTPSVTLDIVRPLGRQSLYLEGDIGYDFHDRFKFLDRARIALEGGARLKRGAFCKLDLSVRADIQQSDLEELGEVVGNSERRLTYLAQGDCARPAGLFPVAAVQRRTADNSREIRERDDFYATRLTGGIGWSIPSVGRLEALASRERFDFPNRPVPVAGGVADDRTDVTSVGLRLNRAVAPRVSFDANVGYAWAKPRSPLAPKFEGLNWSTTVEWKPQPRTRIAFATARTVDASNALSVSYFVAERYGVEIDHRVGARLALEAGASRTSRKLRGSDPLGPRPPRTGDRTERWNVGARYDLRERLSLNAGIGWRKRDANEAFYDYRSTQVSLGARVRF